MSVFKKITSAFEDKRNSFEIVSILDDPKTGLIVIKVKIDGKCVQPVKKDPIELIRKKNYFSEGDQETIISSLLENQKRLIEKKYRKKYSLIKHQFSEQLKEPLILFKDENNRIYIKPAKEIYSNIEKLKQFTSEDSACIGHIVGSHENEEEHKKIRRMKIAKYDILLTFAEME